MKYKYIEGEITSDVMFEAYGKTPQEVFENAAEAMFETICIKIKVKPKRSVKVHVEGKNLKDLFYNWLQELIGLIDIEEMFFSKFNITKISETSLDAEIYGEDITPNKGETVVKAVTYFGFDLRKEKGKYIGTATLDI
ncbi:archease [Candidatus Woesearchaeota archaeon]|nr:archease [Candidatus Woesearchaeota archaeon]